ncbi:MAG: hypothetical protein ACC742_04975 [Thermoanaerobaculales bacterium]
MIDKIRIFLLFTTVLGASICSSASTVEILVDQSDTMWGNLESGRPRFVAVRIALENFILSLAPADSATPEIGMRILGGLRSRTESESCEDTRQVLPIAAVEPQAWLDALAGISPQGRRGLVRAVIQAASGFPKKPGRRRIVVITSGSEECYGDVAEVAAALEDELGSVDLRIIGLRLDPTTVTGFKEVAPTRNVTDTAHLVEALSWAVLPPNPGPWRPQTVEFRFTRGGRTISQTEVVLESTVGGEPVPVTLEEGAARVRLAPGCYGAAVTTAGGPVQELAGIRVAGGQSSYKIDISPAAEVTMEIDPPIPLSGDTAFIQYWGAPTGSNWVALGAAGAPLFEYVGLAKASGPRGEIGISLPASPSTLEARFVHEHEDGLLQVLGRVGFESRKPAATLDVPEKVENRSELTVDWTGPSLPGDHITVTRAKAPPTDYAACIFPGAETRANLVAPVVPGRYVVRYVSAVGQVLAQSQLNVFEVLATLDGPADVMPGAEIAVTWTGPNEEQDHLTITPLEAPGDEYLSWSPTENGSPALLRAPKTPGEYELRYVRDADGEILARAAITVFTTAVTVQAPPTAQAGTRFEVVWTGTPAEGDFLTIAPAGSKPRRHLDWATANVGSPLTLAAPFNPGDYEVRYISGKDKSIVASSPLTVY